MKDLIDTQSIEISAALESWYAANGNGDVIATLRERIQPILARAFGYHVLQLGPVSDRDLLVESPINHRIHAATATPTGLCSVQCDGDELPFESDSIDMIVAFHALELDPNPHGSLREMQRVLRPSGHLLIIGFNPNSALGAATYIRRLRRQQPWHSFTPVSPRRLADWLRLLDCELESTSYLYPLPLLGQGRIRAFIQSIDRWAHRQKLPLGGLYATHAVKRIAGLRRPKALPVLAKSRLRGLAVAGGASPTSSVQPRKSRDIAA